jgi:hypothetical protein
LPVECCQVLDSQGLEPGGTQLALEARRAHFMRSMERHQG